MWEQHPFGEAVPLLVLCFLCNLHPVRACSMLWKWCKIAVESWKEVKSPHASSEGCNKIIYCILCRQESRKMNTGKAVKQ